MTLGVHWFRNDLRLGDNTALTELSGAVDTLLSLYVLDDKLLGAEHVGAPRVRFLLACVAKLARDLETRGHRLVVLRGDPRREVPALLARVGAAALSYNRDTTPYARARDRDVRAAAEAQGVRVIERKDRVIFEGHEVRTRTGRAFAVYSPYRRAWHRRLKEAPQPPGPAPRLPRAIAGVATGPAPEADALGFPDGGVRIPPAGEAAARSRLADFLSRSVEHYPRLRDVPAVDGTSRLSPYLRFGALSVRECVYAAWEAAAAEPRLARGVQKWVDELVWREFYAAILESEPRVLHSSHRRQYDALRWRDDDEGFEAWCRGRTGYPMVDAGMRQLAETGWMHNRARMLAAGFLTKDLLIDWRRGERWFLKHLVDADPASNNGGWQWSASTGTDAAPYFRIMNPVTQGKRFDPEGAYVRRWVPELRGIAPQHVHEPWKAPRPPADYPAPIVDHAKQRTLALELFGSLAEAAR